MKKQNGLFWRVAVFLTMTAFVLAGCKDPSSETDTVVVFNSVTANDSATQTTTQLTLVFDNAIEGLTANDITLIGVDGVAKGTLTGSGQVYTLGISGFTTGGTLTVVVEKAGFVISGTAKSTTIYYYSNNGGGGDTAVTFNSVTANGSSTQSSTELTLTFNQAINGLTANDITLTGVNDIVKGSLSGSGPSYTLGISGFTAGGTVNVAVAKTGYTINGSPKSTAIYYYRNSGGSGGDTAVTFNSVTANGSSTQSSTKLTLTFSQAINGLTANDITLTGVNDIVKGSLSGSGPGYTLGISGFTAGGTVNVAVAKTGYTISGSPKSTAIYYYQSPVQTAPAAPTGVTATALSSSSIRVTWNAVSGATSYKVYHATSSYGTYTFDETSYSTSYTSTGWQSAQTGYFKVTAVNSVGESGYSSPAYAITQVSKPNAPAGVSAVQNGSSINVSWYSVTGATSYRVYRSSSASGTYSQLGTPNGTSYTDSSPLSGNNYYKVSAVNSAGESTQSSYVVCNYAAKPKAPDTFTVTRQSQSSAVIALLSYPLSDKSTVDSYTYKYYVDGQAQFLYTNAPAQQSDGYGTTGWTTSSGSSYGIAIADTTIYLVPGTYKIKVEIINGSQSIMTAEKSITVY